MKRNFYPGDEWLYFKIYGGIKACDDLVGGGRICRLMGKMQRGGLIRQWFFIRYSDPDFHLRLRLNLTDTRLAGDAMRVVNSLLRPLCETQELHKFTIDTYTREIERYGASVMELTEELFCIDSEAVCAILQGIKGLNADYRWITAFVSADSFLSAVGLDLPRKLETLSELSVAYRNEYGYNSHNGKQLNDMYRQRRKVITEALQCPGGELLKLLPIFERRDARIAAAVAGRTHRLNVTSLLHMMMNRHFASQNRTNELLVYDFLKRIYASETARNKAR